MSLRGVRRVGRARPRGRRAGRLAARDVIVPVARDFCTQPYVVARTPPCMGEPCGALLQSVSQLYGEQRTQSHPEFCAACSRQRARITTAGDALASIGQPRTKLSAIIDASLSLIRRETSVLSGGEASAVVSMRPDKKINFTLSQPAALRLVAKISCWCPRPGAPPGAVALRPARWLRWCAKCHRAAAVQAKGLPNLVLATVAWVVVVAVVLPRGRRSGFDHHRPPLPIYRCC